MKATAVRPTLPPVEKLVLELSEEEARSITDELSGRATTVSLAALMAALKGALAR